LLAQLPADCGGVRELLQKHFARFGEVLALRVLGGKSNHPPFVSKTASASTSKSNVFPLVGGEPKSPAAPHAFVQMKSRAQVSKSPSQPGGLYRIGKWPIKRHLRTIRH
jgi:hypothetical protein